MNVLQVGKPAEIPFTDVPQNAWYRDSVARAFGAKLISGTSAVQFQPQALITREQMAVMIANALRYKGVHVSSAATLESFQDRQTIAAWAVDSVRLVAGANIVHGKTGTNGPVFAPKDNATRAEAVVMLKRLLDKLQGPQS
ncbi:S-layer homology domain-containing protein [Desulfoscipio geothermicus]|uniref:S-layer homology domain-containing protein n=1 Tax=Desulfoscipio geothermicus DSM 3669 TaxID=1121426 RepID=A0A1I6DEQ7_9FIRM|nr:S-layer homology domain-containing protein [Desulfoscipio geothermicus]SFR03916.1 S-layer homology domain-containing protein [Desulfoscipio geothermicus DSM 3669]